MSTLYSKHGSKYAHQQTCVKTGDSYTALLREEVEKSKRTYCQHCFPALKDQHIRDHYQQTPPSTPAKSVPPAISASPLKLPAAERYFSVSGSHFVHAGPRCKNTNRTTIYEEVADRGKRAFCEFCFPDSVMEVDESVVECPPRVTAPPLSILSKAVRSSVLPQQQQQQQTPLAPSALELYPFRSAKFGIAVIIANSEYPGEPALSGVTSDAKLLTNALREVGFEVRVHENLTSKDIRRVLEKAAADVTNKSAYRDKDALFVAFLGHGQAGDGGESVVLGVDWRHVSHSALQMACYSGGGAIIGEAPKVMLLDCCRGNARADFCVTTATAAAVALNSNIATAAAAPASVGGSAVGSVTRTPAVAASLFSTTTTAAAAAAAAAAATADCEQDDDSDDSDPDADLRILRGDRLLSRRHVSHLQNWLHIYSACRDCVAVDGAFTPVFADLLVKHHRDSPVRDIADAAAAQCDRGGMQLAHTESFLRKRLYFKQTVLTY